MKKDKYSLSTKERQEHETQFFDQKVSSEAINPSILKISSQYIEGLKSFFQKYSLGSNEIQKSTILDIGCGTGKLAVSLAMIGSRKIYAIDLSLKSQLTTLARARGNDTTDVQPLVMSAEKLGFPDDCFDLVVGSFVLHHLDVHATGQELLRVLKPGGYGFFYENSNKNKFLMFARWLLTGRFGIPKRSDDLEYPLKRSEINTLTTIFENNCWNYYPNFLFLQLVSRIIFKKYSIASKITWKLDKILSTLLPSIDQYSYHQLIIVQKPISK